MRHKWADVIIAYANGEDIQYLNLDEPDGKWQDWDKSCVSHIFFCDTSPNFESHGYEFRVKPKTVKKERWVNVYSHSDGSVETYCHRTRELADSAQMTFRDRTACIRIEWEEEV